MKSYQTSQDQGKKTLTFYPDHKNNLTTSFGK